MATLLSKMCEQPGEDLPPSQVRQPHKEASDLRASVIDFLLANPNPSDEEFHDWAEKNGFNVHDAEAETYKLASEYVKSLKGS